METYMTNHTGPNSQFGGHQIGFARSRYQLPGRKCQPRCCGGGDGNDTWLGKAHIVSINICTVTRFTMAIALVETVAAAIAA